MTGIGQYRAFGGQTRVTETVCTSQLTHAMLVCYGISVTGVLDDFQRAPAALYLEAVGNFVSLTNPCGDVLWIGDLHAHAVVAAYRIGNNSGFSQQISAVGFQNGAKIVEIRIEPVLLKAHAAQFIAAFQRVAVNRKTSAVGTAV